MFLFAPDESTSCSPTEHYQMFLLGDPHIPDKVESRQRGCLATVSSENSYLSSSMKMCPQIGVSPHGMSELISGGWKTHFLPDRAPILMNLERTSIATVCAAAKRRTLLIRKTSHGILTFVHYPEALRDAIWRRLPFEPDRGTAYSNIAGQPNRLMRETAVTPTCQAPISHGVWSRSVSYYCLVKVEWWSTFSALMALHTCRVPDY